MSDFIVSVDSISQLDTENNFRNWLLLQPNYEQYKKLYLGEAGTHLIKMFSGFMAYTNYNTIAGTQDNYLNYVNTREAAIGITSSQYYSAYRGQNHHIQLRVIPDRTYQIQKFEVCGKASGLSISPVRTVNLLQDVPTTIEFAVGDIIEANYTYKDSRLTIASFIEENVTMDMMLLLNNIEVPFSLNVADLRKDMFYTTSNVYGGVDVYYLNYTVPNGSPLYPYNTNDVLTLRYVKHQNINYVFPASVTFNYGAIDDLSSDTRILFNYKNVESKESIQINAPVAYELQKLLRGRLDYQKYFKILNSDFVDTSSIDVPLPVIYMGDLRAIPAFTDVSYIKDDMSLLSNDELIFYTKSLSELNGSAHGIPTSEIKHPKRVDIRFNLTLTQKPNTDNTNYATDIANIFLYEYDIRGIRRNRARKFDYVLDLKDLENSIERLDYVNIARVSMYTKTWQASTVFKRGEFIVPTVPNGFMYEIVSDTYNNLMVNVGATTSSTQPTWSTSNGIYNYEGAITQWLPNTAYALNALVYPPTQTGFVYKAVQAGTSNSTSPTFGLIRNQQFFDNTVVWQTYPIDTIKNVLIYKTIPLDAFEFQAAWNEYYYFNYGSGVTWLS